MSDIDVLLDERRRFAPPDHFRKHAVVRDPAVYARAAANPEEYWASRARELEWFTPWTRVLEWSPPHVKWFLAAHSTSRSTVWTGTWRRGTTSWR